MADTDFQNLEGYYQQRTLEYQRPWLVRLLSAERPALNIILFLLTCVSTFYIGYFQFESISDGLWYGGGIITILFCHEMGHYLMCRRHGVRATLPFFIPFPMLPFGTLGAVIRMDSRMPSRRVLFDIGVAGPLAGLAVTIPAIYFGLKMPQQPIPSGVETVTLGESILFKLISWLAIGPLPEETATILHPLAYAGWAGLFVTALNLLPIGQLDGGHILYALLGERSNLFYSIAVALFALLCIIEYRGWILLIILLLWFGYRHPPTMDHFTPLDSKRRLVAYLTLVIFLLSFTPKPFYA
jgi:membrane-associated protease RseP (regulator of RpoE activity)